MIQDTRTVQPSAMSRIAATLRSIFTNTGAESKLPNHGTKSDVAQAFDAPPSFLTFLPFRDFDAETGVFIFDDGKNCGILFEVSPAPTEARSDAELEDVAEAIAVTIREAIPEEIGSPWIIQAYATNERSLYQTVTRFENYVKAVNPGASESAFAANWLKVVREHLDQVGRAEGIFFDKAAKNIAWSGKQTRQFITLYRMHDPRSFAEAAASANDVAESVQASMLQGGIKLRRCTATDLYEWLFPWFSPRPPSTGGDPHAYLRESQILDSARNETLEDVDGPVVRASDVVAGYDLGDSVVLGTPRSDEPNQCWWFNGLPHRVLTMQQLTRSPRYGHLTGERRFGDSQMTLLDQMPEGTTFVVTVVIRPQHETREDLEMIQLAARGPREESRAAKEEARQCAESIEAGNKMFPMELSVYVRGESIEHLNKLCNEVNGVLRNNGLRMIEQQHDLFAIHKYLQQLPFGYNYSLDKKRTNRSRLTFSRQIARLLPLCGRSTGTGNPGLILFNRGAEPLLVDPIRDRIRNAHALVLGPSGSGKSAYLSGLLLQTSAVHDPRIFVIDPSASFGEVAAYCKAHGMSVEYLRLGAPGVSLNPYADALELLKSLEEVVPTEDQIEDQVVWDWDDDEDIRRDLMGGMVQKTHAMIVGSTGGRAATQISNHAKFKLKAVIRDAAQTVAALNAVRREAREPELQVVTSDVMAAMTRAAERDNDVELRDMAYALGNFCGSDTLAGRLFDKQGTPMPEADLTIIEFGMLAREQYEAEMVVATMTMFDRIHFIAEKYQHERRPIIVYHDEVHMQLKRPALAPYIVGIVKLWRKLGAWYWAATQDFEDISDNAKVLINNLEWMFSLQMGEADVKALARFREVSAEDEALLLAPRKQPGDYVEGVMIRKPDIRMLFRSVLPPIALALAGTEKDEKALRKQLMRDHSLGSMVEANEMIASQIREKRQTATTAGSSRRRWQK